MTDDWEFLARSDPFLSSRYALGSLIGRGRGGDVYRATCRSTGTPVVVKLLARVSESRTGTQLVADDALFRPVEHENVVSPITARVLVAPSGIEINAIVSPYQEGKPLTAELACGALPLARALRILSQVLAALSAVHGAGLVHGDPKPADILVGEHDRVWLTDVGTPREPLPMGLLGRPVPSGTAEYLAPEVIEGAAPTPASDIYSLGVVAIEMLTGRNPLAQPSLRETLGHRPPSFPALPPDLSGPFPELAALIARMVDRDPCGRPDVETVLVGVAGLARQITSRGTVVRLPVGLGHTRVEQDAPTPLPRRPWPTMGRWCVAVLVMLGFLWGAEHLRRQSEWTVQCFPGATHLFVRVHSLSLTPEHVRLWSTKEPEEKGRVVRLSRKAPEVSWALIDGLKPGHDYSLRPIDLTTNRQGHVSTFMTLESSKVLLRRRQWTYLSGERARLELVPEYPTLAVVVRNEDGHVIPTSRAGTSLLRSGQTVSPRPVPRPGSGAKTPSVVPDADTVTAELTLSSVGANWFVVHYPDLGESIQLDPIFGAVERARQICQSQAKLESGALGLGLGSAGRPLLTALVRALRSAPTATGNLKSARKIVDDWMKNALSIDQNELANLVCVMASDQGVSAIDRWLFYRLLARLEDIDALGRECGLSSDLVGFSSLAGRFVSAESPSGGPSSLPVFRPFAASGLADPIRLALESGPLPLPMSDPGLTERTLVTDSVFEVFEPLRVKSRDIPSLALPVDDPIPGSGSRVEIAVRVCGMSLSTRLTIDLGSGVEILLRSRRPLKAPILALGRRPRTSVLEPLSGWFVARVPAPQTVTSVILAATDPSVPNRGDDPPARLWILDLMLFRVE